MSLVNDMLRNLERRRAAPTERLRLDGLWAVDEAGAARRKRFQRVRTALTGLALIILIGLPLGVLIDRLLESPALPHSVTAMPVAPAAPPRAIAGGPQPGSEAAAPPVVRKLLVAEQGSKYCGNELPPEKSSPKFGARTEC